MATLNPFSTEGTLGRRAFLRIQVLFVPIGFAAWLAIDQALAWLLGDPPLWSRAVSADGRSLALRVLAAIPFIAAPMLLGYRRLRHAGRPRALAALLPWPLSLALSLAREPAPPRPPGAHPDEGPYRTAPPLPPPPLIVEEWPAAWLLAWVTASALVIGAGVTWRWRHFDDLTAAGHGVVEHIVTGEGSACVLRSGARCRGPSGHKLRFVPESRLATAVAVDRSNAYFIATPWVVSAPLDRQRVAHLAALEDVSGEDAISVDRDFVYFSPGAFRVARVARAGGPVQELGRVPGRVRQVLLDGSDDLLVAADAAVVRMRRDGAGEPRTLDVASYYDELVADERAIYWIDLALRLRRLPRDGEHAVRIEGPNDLRQLALGGGRLFASQIRPHTLLELDPEGRAAPVELVREPEPITDLHFADGSLLWATPDGIRRLR